MENVCLLWLLAVKTACVSTFQQPWPISCPKVETGMSGHDFSRNSLHKAVCAVKTAKEPLVCPVSQNAKRALGCDTDITYYYYLLDDAASRQDQS